MLVKEVLSRLASRDPNEQIAMTGFWYQEDVEYNNDIKLTPEQWETICMRHEGDHETHIDDLVWDVTH